MAATPYTLRLSPQIFNTSLINSLLKTWFAEQPATAAAPNAENMGKWFGVGRTAEQRAAFDAHLHSTYGAALDALSPTQLALPPFHNAATDRANAATLCLPLRRLSLLKTPAQDPSTPNQSFDERARAGLGLVLLLDQLPRNCFRAADTQSKVFAHYDRLARALVHCMLAPQPTPAPPAAPADDDATAFADLAGLHAAPAYRDSWLYRCWFYLPLVHSEDLAEHDIFNGILDGVDKDMRERGHSEEAREFVKQAAVAEKQHRDLLERFGRYPHRNECLGREMTDDEKAFLEGGGVTFSAAQRNQE